MRIGISWLAVIMLVALVAAVTSVLRAALAGRRPTEGGCRTGRSDQPPSPANHRGHRGCARRSSRTRQTDDGWFARLLSQLALLAVMGLVVGGVVFWSQSRQMGQDQAAQVRLNHASHQHAVALSHVVQQTGVTDHASGGATLAIDTFPVLALMIPLLLAILIASRAGRTLLLASLAGVGMLLIFYLVFHLRSAPDRTRAAEEVVAASSAHDDLESHLAAWERRLVPRIDLSEETPPPKPPASPTPPSGENSLPADGENPTDAQPLPENNPSTAANDRPAASDLPEWVLKPRKSSRDVYRRVLDAGPYVTAEECYRDLETVLSQAAQDFAQQYARRNWGITDQTMPALSTLGVNLDHLLNEVVTDHHVETVDTSFGPMKHVYVEVEFRPRQLTWLGDLWRSQARSERIVWVATSAGGILSAVAMAFTLLQLDNRTQGKYRKRLFLVVPAVIIGVVGLLVA